MVSLYPYHSKSHQPGLCQWWRAIDAYNIFPAVALIALLITALIHMPETGVLYCEQKAELSLVTTQSALKETARAAFNLHCWCFMEWCRFQQWPSGHRCWVSSLCHCSLLLTDSVWNSVLNCQPCVFREKDQPKGIILTLPVPPWTKIIFHVSFRYSQQNG